MYTDFEQFRLTEGFLEKYVGQQPEWGPVGYVTYRRTYSRPLPNGQTEEFWQTLQRVVEGTYAIQKTHCRYFGLPWNQIKAQKSAQRMFELMWEMKFLPPGRGLWAMGTDYIKTRSAAPLLSCAFTSTKDLATDFADPFMFLMDMSMLGVGVGGDTRGAGTVVIKQPKQSEYIFTVPDTREGWCAIAECILLSYVGKAAKPLSIDYSLVRPAGVPIKTFGGIAAGPEPLRQLVEIDIPSVLDPLIGKPITSTAIVDIFNFVGKCVVSGNVRRSAEILFGNPTDEEFLLLKDPTLHKTELEDRRWCSNNSVIVEPETDFSRLANLTAINGEPGFFWLKNAQAWGRMCDPPTFSDMRVQGANPCVEQSLEDRELCCLVENFIARCSSLEEFKEVLKHSYLYAKTVTLLPTHNQRSNAVMMRNRRIGCSLAGISRAIGKLGYSELVRWLDEGYRHIRYLDRIYSEWLCIPESVKVTSIKPGGTIPLLPGEPPGMHFPHSEYYIRNIRIGDKSPLVDHLTKAGFSVEKDIYTPNTVVIIFPFH